MIDYLRKVAREIDELIRNDPFPESIRPEYLRSAVRDYPGRGGKRIRPALLIWSCAMLGGSEEAALYPAAAAEVFHNWTLVHDDIIDRDVSRRGAPTCHVTLAEEMKQFPLDDEARERSGRDFAILAGDLQQGWANDLLLRSVEHGVPPRVVLALSRKLQKLANAALITGEALDVEFSLRPITELSASQIREMLYLKTGALLRFCAEAGAMIALNADSAEPEEVKILGEFAAAAGIAFQLRDDYLGLFGDYSSLGKPLGADLREGKATILLLTTLQMASGEDKAVLTDLIGRAEYSPTDLDTVRRIMHDSGATAMIDAETAQLAERARNLLREFPDNIYRQCLIDLINFLINRER